MTYAVLSDIHGNLEALPAVEAALDALPVRIDAYRLLGDLVGYNADPAACLERGLAIARPLRPRQPRQGGGRHRQ